MGKVLLFHNNAEYQPPLRFSEILDMSFNEVIDRKVMKSPYGNRNTGTYIMTDTLKKIIDADEYIPRFYEFTDHVDTVITNILHRIGGNLKVDIPYWKNILNHADRVVPLSMGFAFENGNIAPLDKELNELLHMFAERCELGVRTEYDAEFLNDNGIKNVRVIGCPSLFYHMNRNFVVDDSSINVNRVNFNFSTDFGNLGISQKNAVETHWPLLLYFKIAYERNDFGIDFTMQKQPLAEVTDIHNVLISYAEVYHFYKNCGRYFYNAKDWISAIKDDDFSMGSRFHGNVAAILAGIPTLMVNIDKRMEGLNRYFKIPSINISEFDMNKPIAYYRELADYSEFNRNYPKVFDNFVDYCNKNGVPLKLESEETNENQ